jgi:hypothetical protein
VHLLPLAGRTSQELLKSRRTVRRLWLFLARESVRKPFRVDASVQAGVHDSKWIQTDSKEKKPDTWARAAQRHTRYGTEDSSIHPRFR